MLKNVVAKLGNMKKPQEFCVYPEITGAEGMVQIQSDKRICRFDPSTGKGMLSMQKPSGAYGVHLNPALGAMEVEVPKELIAECLAAKPKKGDQIGPGVYVG